MNQVRKKVAGLMPLHQYEVTCLACTPPLIATENRRKHAQMLHVRPVDV